MLGADEPPWLKTANAANSSPIHGNTFSTHATAFVNKAQDTSKATISTFVGSIFRERESALLKSIV